MIVFAALLFITKGQQTPLLFKLLALFILILPGLYLHLLYYLKNKDSYITVDNDSISIKDDSGLTVVIPFEEITLIELHASGGIFKRIDWENFYFQSYHYLKLYTKSKQYYLSSLLFDKPIEIELFDFIEINKEKFVRVKEFISLI